MKINEMKVISSQNIQAKNIIIKNKYLKKLIKNKKRKKVLNNLIFLKIDQNLSNNFLQKKIMKKKMIIIQMILKIRFHQQNLMEK